MIQRSERDTLIEEHHFLCTRAARKFVRVGVEMNDLVREVAELCEPELRRCGVELMLDLSGEPTAVFADPIRIQQVLVNLIQNAMQALREIEGRKQIAIRTLHAEEGVQVDVAASRNVRISEGFGDLGMRVAVIDIFDRSNQIRSGTGIGVGAPQFGPRAGLYLGLTKPFGT